MGIRCCACYGLRPWKSLAACASAVLMGSCTFLIEVKDLQCESDRDCVLEELGSACVEGICSGDLVSSDGLEAADCDGGSCYDGGQGSEVGCDERRCGAGEQCFDGACLSDALYGQVVCVPVESQIPDRASTAVTLRMHVQEFISASPPMAMRVQACRTSDATCSNPVVIFEDTQATGDIALTLPSGFMGFLKVSGDDVLPSLWYMTRPLERDQTFKDLLVVAPGTLMALASITGYSVDAGKGLVILESFDCEQRALGGVHFDEEKGGALPFYIVNEAPNVDVNVSVRDDDNDIAIGGFLNAEVGFNQFSAHLGIDGPLLGTFNARVAASTVTYIDLYRP